MQISTTSQKLMILCLLVTGTSACNFLPVSASQVRSAQESKESYPGKGLIIASFVEDSPAPSVGLKRMDIIFRYGDFEVVDDASYFAARETYEKRRETEIPIIAWRDGRAVRVTVRPGWLGIMTNEYGPVANQFSSLMANLDGQRQIPEFQRDREFKGGYIPEEKILDEAKQLIDQAERESTLTPTQILVARIYMTPDDASPEELKLQSERLGQLIATQPESYIHMLSQDRFFANKHYRPAVACFQRHLELHPDDVSLRLNMGFAYHRLGMFTEAEAAADYVIDNQLGVSSHGQNVTYSVKAMGLLGRAEYAKSISFAEKAFNIEPCECDTSIILMAAAQTGDLQKLAEASRKFQQFFPEEFKKSKLMLAAVEAYALVKSNQRPRARLLAQEWKNSDRSEGRVKSAWKFYPGGSDVSNNWNELMRDSG